MHEHNGNASPATVGEHRRAAWPHPSLPVTYAAAAKAGKTAAYDWGPGCDH